MTERQDQTERAGTPLAADAIEALREGVVEALHTVYDPEIPVDIYELGLIYDINIALSGDVAIKMTLTAPGCPVAGSMPGMVKDAVKAVESVGDVDVELVWDPPWDRSRMSETAQLALGMI
ncbi:MAG: SUF system Fe-S cluster assembly protein [Dongiaceae bacterium]